MSLSLRRSTLSLLAAAALILLPPGVQATWGQPASASLLFVLQEELPSGPCTSLFTGCGLPAIGGDTALVKAETGLNVFERDPVTDIWAQVAFLSPSDAPTEFGRAFAVDGDAAIVGAEGAVYFFARAPVWRQVASVVVPEDDPEFGRVPFVDIDGGHAIVGFSSTVHIFRRSGQTWTKVAEILIVSPPSLVVAVAISGRTAVIAASDGLPAPSGATYLFDADVDDEWRFVKRVPDAPFVFNAFTSIDLVGDTLVIGAGQGGHEGPGGFRWVLRMFERNRGGADAWGESLTYVACCGWSAGLGVDYMFVTSAFGGGADDVFARTSGTVWARHQGASDAWGTAATAGVNPDPRVSKVRFAVDGDSILIVGLDLTNRAVTPVRVFVSDVDRDGIRDGRDPCPRDPLNNTAGGCQRDATAYPNLNESIALGNVTTETQDGEFVITATFTNTSNTPIHNPFFEVIDLSGGNELVNADSDYGGLGATLSPDVGDGILQPGEPTTVTFRIRLASFDQFSFLVNVRGTPEAPTQ